MRDPHGQPWRVVDLPTPGYLEKDGQRLPASYANFYIANEVVVMPAFNHPTTQRRAISCRSFFPPRRVVMLSPRST